MRIEIKSPEISSLRNAVELRFGRVIKTPRDFLSLVEDLFLLTGERLSETTLQRIWLYKSGYSTVAVHSLDVLAKYIGAKDWMDYQANVEKYNGAESDMIPSNAIKVSDLAIGTKIKIAWRPDRECTLLYLGNYRFEVLETKNSKLLQGDKFTCTSFQLGRGLRMDNIVRGFEELTYIAGSRTGLISLEILDK